MDECETHGVCLASERETMRIQVKGMRTGTNSSEVRHDQMMTRFSAKRET